MNIFKDLKLLSYKIFTKGTKINSKTKQNGKGEKFILTSKEHHQDCHQ